VKYIVHGLVTVSCWTAVEAVSEKDAIFLAAQREMAEVLIDGGYPVDECWHLGSD
jgi:hypothetical protein